MPEMPERDAPHTYGVVDYRGFLQWCYAAGANAVEPIAAHPYCGGDTAEQ